MEYEMEGSRARGRQKSTWREIVEKNCQVNWTWSDATDLSRWRKL